MYKYVWDEETGGLLLTSEISRFSKEPRPVYYKELDLLGFDKYWNYPKDDSRPLMWAEANNYIYKGRTVARVSGGSLYTAPEIVLLEEPEQNGDVLQFVDIGLMVQKNAEIMEGFVQDTIKNVYNVYNEYKNKVDLFYVAFSGGKDSVVALDIVQRALPHSEFKILFGDTRMELPDTYDAIEKIKEWCKTQNIEFYVAQSNLVPEQTWKIFGPPSTTNRWCCSVHKTSPQINLLRKLTSIYDFTGMAFTGVRWDESARRSEYDEVTDGKKHSGQKSFHTILEWGSAELYLYIFSRNLVLNNAYKKGISRAGCLVCPNSSGKHEYIKRICYPEETKKFLDYISLTSGKTNYTQEEMNIFIDMGYWRTRKSGRELNFGQDCFDAKLDTYPQKIIVFKSNIQWEKWAKTIGELIQVEDNLYTIKYLNKLYQISIEKANGHTVFTFLNCDTSKDDTRFLTLFKSVVIKTLYCVGCGVCETECKSHCIDMSNGIKIGDNCIHCHKCHDVHEHCLRYGSIRNKLTEGKKMVGLDRYFSFGARVEWLEVFCKYKGGTEFWTTDGDYKVANKKKDAFKNFAQDAGLIEFRKDVVGDKYTKCVPTNVAETIIKLGAKSSSSWAIILCNLAYTPAYNWFVNNLNFGVKYTPDFIRVLLSDVMENDIKGLGKRNVLDSLKIVMSKTPLGTDKIFADCEIDEKIDSSGNEKISLISLTRTPWENPDSRVILYSLYKFAEACGDIYQFTLEYLSDDSIEREGISPTRIFGLDRNTMIRILNGLTANYPEFISASFTLDLDSITLRPAGTELTSQDVLKLF